MVYIGSIDQGTSSTRFLVFDSTTAQVVASSQVEVTHITPKSGWLEEDPEEIYQSVVTTINNVLFANPDISIDAIGITNQRETSIVWDTETGKPLHNAIVWCDGRTQETVTSILQENRPDDCGNPEASIDSKTADEATQNRIKEQTGLPISTYFSATKIRWMIDNCETVATAVREGRAAFGTVDSWLVYKLSAGARHATDPTNACRTLLYNINNNDWDDELLSFFGIPESLKLPEIMPSSTNNFCTIQDTRIDERLRNVPVTGVLGDQQAALVGQKCLTPGQLKNTYGTGCFLLQNTGKERVFSKSGLLTTVGYQKQNGEFVYAIEGSIGVAGLLIRWLRDQMQFFKDAAEVETMASNVEDSGGVYIVPAFSGLFCPYWASDARGVICGLTQFSNRNHIARACLEAVAWQVRDIVDAMRADGQPCTMLKADGGMTANKLLMQIQSDILQIPVMVPEMSESTALGAAVASGSAIGQWRAAGWELLSDNTTKASNESGSDSFTKFEPKNNMDTQFAKWKKAVQRSVGWEDVE